MAIVEHQLEMHKVKLTHDLAADLPLISGNANQIQQVLINLMINAQQAMQGSGEVSISTSNGNSETSISLLLTDQQTESYWNQRTPKQKVTSHTI